MEDRGWPEASDNALLEQDPLGKCCQENKILAYSTVKSAKTQRKSADGPTLFG